MKLGEAERSGAFRLSVAPMMDWTDRHCRYLHRQLTRRTLLYTEMVTAAALVRGGARHLLDHDPAEHPLALQIGGSDPAELARAARMGADAGFAEINLNCGCPSDRVQSGAFGAVLMRNPALIGECLAAMRAASPAEATLKCRLGVDEQDPEDALGRTVEAAAAAGVRRIVVHARKAWLQGLSPKENREVPPLDHGLVVALKRSRPDLRIVVNGGIGDLDAAQELLATGLDGAMIGRAAYQRPALLARADTAIFGAAADPGSPEAAARVMIGYAERHVAAGGAVHAVTRHMLGLFAGRPGARAWRRHLSTAAVRPGAGSEVIGEGLALLAAEAGTLDAAGGVRAEAAVPTSPVRAARP